jgi:hypothetical protein
VKFNLPILNLLATYPALYQNKSNEVKSKLLLLSQNEEEARTKSSCDKQQGDHLHAQQNKVNRPLGTVITQATTQQVDYSVQGRRKHKKVGGGGFEGHVSNEKGTWRRGGGGGGPTKNFPDIS